MTGLHDYLPEACDVEGMPRVPRAQPTTPPVVIPPTNGHSRNGHSVTADVVDQTRLLAALRGVRAGDFGVRLPLDWTGVSGDISEVFNEVVELNQQLTREFERISQTVGREGKTEQRASFGNASGSWATCIDSINTLI